MERLPFTHQIQKNVRRLGGGMENDMKLIPQKKQLKFLDWEFGVFFHFGIRSFYPGHNDWDGIEMPPEGFAPTALDCEQWVRTAKEAGATYTILTTKHHDGFALWPSAYSRYSVANTPWREGRGDVVREYVDACRKYDMKVGLYYSPAQWGSYSVPFSNDRDYDDYFINQISELLTNYGKIDYLWFDGCGSEGHVYDHARIVTAIYRLQPDILTFCDPEWTPCIRWVGNEDGYASLDNPLVVSSTDFSELAKEAEQLSEAAFLPSECDAKIRRTWFYDNNEDTLKSVDELFGMYEMSVGHGSNFLLNVGPDDRGLIPEADAARLAELGARIRDSYGTPAHFGAPAKCGDEYTITHLDVETDDWKLPHRERLVNCLMLKEDLTNGQSVTSFNIYAHLPEYRHKRILLFSGKTIGHKVYCKFSPLRASKLTVEITGHDGDYAISDMKAFFVK